MAQQFHILSAAPQETCCHYKSLAGFGLAGSGSNFVLLNIILNFPGVPCRFTIFLILLALPFWWTASRNNSGLGSMIHGFAEDVIHIALLDMSVLLEHRALKVMDFLFCCETNISKSLCFCFKNMNQIFLVWFSVCKVSITKVNGKHKYGRKVWFQNFLWFLRLNALSLGHRFLVS